MPAQQSPLSDRSAGSCQEGKHGQDVGLATHYSKPEDASCNHGKEAETIPSEQCGEHVYKHAPRSSEEQTALDELLGFLSWRPPALVAHENHSKSKGSRPPAHYDMHLSDDLTLKNIVILPDLLTEIASVTDNCMPEKIPSLGAPGPPFLESFRSQHYGAQMPQILNEEVLPDIYGKGMSHYCVTAASTLAFGLPSWQSLLSWSKRGISASRSSAIADGYLSVDIRALEQAAESLALASEDDAKDLRRVLDLDLSDVAIWEFKSLVAGDESTMRAIEKLHGPFPWVKCSAAKVCDHTMHTNKEKRYARTGRPTGPDSLCPIWKLPAVDDPQPGQNKRKGGPSIEEHPDSIPAVIDSDPAVNHSIPAVISSTKSKSSGGKRSAGGKRRAVAKGSVGGKRSAGSENSDVSNPEKARHIVQQVWAEAVQSDATVLVIDAGNLQFIGVRHRDRQTLYLSKLYRVTESPPCGKLHTGLYIAAIRDAIARAKQISHDLEHNLRLPVRYTRVYDFDRDSQTQKSSIMTPEERAKVAEQNQEIMAAFETQGKTMMHWKSGSGVPICRPSGLTLIPHAPVASSLLSGYRDKAVVLNLITPYADYTFSASLEFPGEFQLENELVVKLAISDADRQDLRDEFSTYKMLEERELEVGLVKNYGLFRFDHAEGDEFRVLVMVLGFGGISLQDRHKKIAMKTKDELIAYMKTLHDAGFVHGSVYPKHLLVKSDQTASIVGWRSFQDYNDRILSVDDENLSEEDTHRRRRKEFQRAQQNDLENLTAWLAKYTY